ncbi:MAG: YihY/virulence factor BrkB family protein [Clostridia bacterium]|nr:YihY/virulence factor BrkB family protein [Clostridia bacterium]
MKRLKSILLRIWTSIVKFFQILSEDKITVYAAQSAFFIIVSAIPFIILLIGLGRYLIDIEWLLGLISRHIGGAVGNVLTLVVKEVVAKTGASLMSITIVTIIWSASQGVYSVTKGIASAYGVHLRENFLFDIIRSFLYTLVFIFIIIFTLVFLVFARAIITAAQIYFPIVTVIWRVVYKLAPVILTVMITLFFALIFNTVSRKGRNFSRAEYKHLSGKLPRGFLAQLPGAAFAALGWVLFSYFFSLYVRSFPAFSYIYGSLTTVMLLMLWIYFCMFIFLLGAEVNKMVFYKWNIGKLHKEYVLRKKRRKATLARIRSSHDQFLKKK